MTAWESSNVRVERTDLANIDARLAGLAMPVATPDFFAMITAVQKTYGKLEFRDRPSKAYLAVKLEEVDEGGLKPEKLEIVTNEDTADANSSIQEQFDAKGQRRIVRTVDKIKLPVDMEEFRHRRSTGLLHLLHQL